MMDEVLKHCCASWAAWFPDERHPALSAVLMTRSRLGDRAVAIVMSDGQSEARLVVKLGWSGEAAKALAAESANLRSIPERFPGLTAAHPRHLSTRRLSQGVAMISTAVPGVRWRLDRPRFRRSTGVTRVLRCCAAAADATTCGVTTDTELHKLSSLAPLAAWGARELPAARDRSLNALAHHLQQSSVGFHTRWQHGDLATGNILMGRASGVGLVDWELADRLPSWFDLCYVADAAAFELGPAQNLVQWIIRDVVAPRWQEPFPLEWGLALTALLSARRAQGLGRSSKTAWLEVAAAMLPANEMRRTTA